MSAAETIDMQPSNSPVHLSRQMRQLAEDLAAERAEHDTVVSALSEAHRMQAVLERDKAVAEAQARQLERLLEHARVERSLLSSRMAALMHERDLALRSLGWWSRRRFERLNESKATHPSQSA